GRRCRGALDSAAGRVAAAVTTVRAGAETAALTAVRGGVEPFAYAGTGLVTAATAGLTGAAAVSGRPLSGELGVRPVAGLASACSWASSAGSPLSSVTVVATALADSSAWLAWLPSPRAGASAAATAGAAAGAF